MHTRTGKLILFIIVVIAVILAGCTGRTNAPAPTQPVDQATEGLLNYTQAAETISAELTRVAPVTQAPDAQALPTNTPTEEPLPPTSTPLPTDTPLPSDTPLPTETPLPTDTPVPLESPTATIPPQPNWQLVINDDFTTSQFWSEDRSEGFRLRYAGGGYEMTNNVIGDQIFSTRTDTYGAVRIEATGQRITGPLDSYFGVICNFVNGGNYYLFAVAPDGWYGIIKKQTGKISILQEGMDTTGSFQAGTNPVTIRGDCYNGQLVMYVNGVQMATVRDLSFTGGSVGLGLGTRKTAGATVLFDNFSIYTPSQQPAATPQATP